MPSIINLDPLRNRESEVAERDREIEVSWFVKRQKIVKEGRRGGRNGMGWDSMGGCIALLS